MLCRFVLKNLDQLKQKLHAAQFEENFITGYLVHSFIQAKLSF